MSLKKRILGFSRATKESHCSTKSKKIEVFFLKWMRKMAKKNGTSTGHGGGWPAGPAGADFRLNISRAQEKKLTHSLYRARIYRTIVVSHTVGREAGY